MNRVVITGIGIVSSIGIGKEEVVESLKLGKCGIVLDKSRSGFRSALTGYIPDLESPNRLLAPESIYLYHALKEVLDSNRGDNWSEYGLIVGNDGSSQANREAIEKFKEVGTTSKLGSTHLYKSLTSNPSAILTNLFGLHGTSFTIGGACASGGHAIGVAYNLIRNGCEQAILSGGCQEINPDATFSFDALRGFSSSEDPKEAVRTFDRERNGLVPSGGAACFLLEDYSRAIQRGATIYAEIVGYGSNSSALFSKGDIESEYLCMKKALGDVPPEEVGLVSAHATGTVIGDYAEAEAISQLFPSSTKVIATKTLTGHEMWAAGATEIAYALISVLNNFLPPHKNSVNPICGLNINREMVTLDQKPKYILSNSFGLGGTNSSILLKL